MMMKMMMKMKTYAFEKLYTDLVTDDGTVCIVYLTWTSILGVRHGSAGIELYTPDGKREVIHARETPICPEIGSPSWSIVLEVPGGSFELYHVSRARHGAWSPSRDDTSTDMQWSVKSACADAEARFIATDGKSETRPRLRGRGYADWVVLNKMTTGLGLARVDWGRAHVGESTTVIWNRIRTTSGDEWTRALVIGSSDEARVESKRLEIAESSSDGSARELTMTPGNSPISIHLDAGRVLHEGPALDRERFPSWTLRNIARLVTPAMEETRWVRRARIGDECGWALHERVFFGSAA